MRGENPGTTYLEDAEHWVGATTDLVILEAEHARLRGRFDFWEQRRRELA